MDQFGAGIGIRGDAFNQYHQITRVWRLKGWIYDPDALNRSVLWSLYTQCNQCVNSYVYETLFRPANIDRPEVPELQEIGSTRHGFQKLIKIDEYHMRKNPQTALFYWDLDAEGGYIDLKQARDEQGERINFFGYPSLMAVRTRAWHQDGDPDNCSITIIERTAEIGYALFREKRDSNIFGHDNKRGVVVGVEGTQLPNHSLYGGCNYYRDGERATLSRSENELSMQCENGKSSLFIEFNDQGEPISFYGSAPDENGEIEEVSCTNLVKDPFEINFPGDDDQ